MTGCHTNTATAPLSACHEAPEKTLPIQADLSWSPLPHVPPDWSHTDRCTNHVCAKDSGTNHVRVKPWLTLYKLTGWLVSLDLRQPYTRRILSHQTASPHALYDELVLNGVRGKPMDDFVDRASGRELPASKTTRDKAWHNRT